MASKYYSIRSILSYDWCFFYLVIGARGIGKSFSSQDFLLRQWHKKGVEFYILRLSNISVQQLLANNAQMLFDSILVEKYHLELSVKGSQVYNKGKPLCKVFSLSDAPKLKGAGLYDDNYKGWINILIDEFQREPKERNTYPLLYNMTSLLHTICRFRENKVRVIMCCNQLEHANAILANWNWIPQKFGRYVLKSKRAVIDYVDDSPEYKKKHKRSIAYCLTPDASNFTNKMDELDMSLIQKINGLCRPISIIKFSKEPEEWFVQFQGGRIRRWKNEANLPVIAMRPYLNERYDKSKVQIVFEKWNNKTFRFNDKVSLIFFEQSLRTLLRSS